MLKKFIETNKSTQEDQPEPTEQANKITIFIKNHSVIILSILHSPKSNWFRFLQGTLVLV